MFLRWKKTKISKCRCFAGQKKEKHDHFCDFVYPSPSIFLGQKTSFFGKPPSSSSPWAPGDSPFVAPGAHTTNISAALIKSFWIWVTMIWIGIFEWIWFTFWLDMIHFLIGFLTFRIFWIFKSIHYENIIHQWWIILIFIEPLYHDQYSGIIDDCCHIVVLLSFIDNFKDMI